MFGQVLAHGVSPLWQRRWQPSLCVGSKATLRNVTAVGVVVGQIVADPFHIFSYEVQYWNLHVCCCFYYISLVINTNVPRIS